MSSRKAAKSAALLTALAVLLGGCGQAPGQASPRSETSEARLTVSAEGTGPMYVEGAVRFVVLARDGEVVFEGRLGDAPLVRAIEPGSYTISHHARPCSANCDFLDPPTDECAAGLTARAGGTVAAVIHLGPEGGCRIAIDGG